MTPCTYATDWIQIFNSEIYRFITLQNAFITLFYRYYLDISKKKTSPLVRLNAFIVFIPIGPIRSGKSIYICALKNK